jgi:hypothetical protein
MKEEEKIMLAELNKMADRLIEFQGKIINMTGADRTRHIYIANDSLGDAYDNLLSAIYHIEENLKK